MCTNLALTAHRVGLPSENQRDMKILECWGLRICGRLASWVPGCQAGPHMVVQERLVATVALANGWQPTRLAA